jgi:hypothetical protein
MECWSNGVLERWQLQSGGDCEMNRAAEADAIKKHLSLFIPNLSPPNVFTGGPAGISGEAKFSWRGIRSILF